VNRCRGRSTKSLPALLADALNETIVVTIDGRRRKITKVGLAPLCPENKVDRLIAG